MEELRTAFLAAADGLEPEAACDAMGLAYFDLIADRSRLLMQLQMYVSVSAAESDGDSEVGEAVRAMWTELWDTVAEAAGMDQQQVTEFFAQGMLINVLVAMGFPPEHRLWQGFGLKP
jgi:hypothetical protein